MTQACRLALVLLTLGAACSSAPRAHDASADGAAGAAGSDDADDAGDDVPGADDANADAAGFTWTEAAPCPLARFEANGAVIGGELWVLGGFSSSGLAVTKQVDIYNPAADTWRPGPALPGAETHIGVVAAGSDLVVFGGFTGTFAGPRPPETSEVWRWSAADSQWNPGPPLPTPGAAFAWALVGTALHVAGGLAPDGQSDSGVHVMWDLAGDAAWTSLPTLPDPRNHGGGAASGGLFYAIAGRHQWNEISGDVFDVDAFDPVAGAWTSRAAIPVGRSEIGASTSAMSDGRILVVGGSVAGVMPSADVFIYDPAADVWSNLPPLPARRKGAVAARIGPRIVVTTGSPTSVDPSATTWTGCCL